MGTDINHSNSNAIVNNIHPKYTTYYETLSVDKTVIPDIGCTYYTGHLNTTGHNRQELTLSPRVIITNGTSMQVTHDCELPLTSLFKEARHVNMYPENK
jgi:hypothetical protein